jgi:hypothetical protein
MLFDSKSLSSSSSAAAEEEMANLDGLIAFGFLTNVLISVKTFATGFPSESNHL